MVTNKEKWARKNLRNDLFRIFILAKLYRCLATENLAKNKEWGILSQADSFVDQKLLTNSKTEASSSSIKHDSNLYLQNSKTMHAILSVGLLWKCCCNSHTRANQEYIVCSFVPTIYGHKHCNNCEVSTNHCRWPENYRLLNARKIKSCIYCFSIYSNILLQMPLSFQSSFIR